MSIHRFNLKHNIETKYYVLRRLLLYNPLKPDLCIDGIVFANYNLRKHDSFYNISK